MQVELTGTRRVIVEKHDVDSPAKLQVVPYRTPARPEPPVSGIDAFAGILISGVALLVITFMGVSLALAIGAATQSLAIVIGILMLSVSSGIWFLHRLAQGEKDINKGLMIGIYIGIGMYLLLLGTCVASVMGVWFQGV